MSCCGKRLEPLPAQKAADGDRLHVSPSDGEWYVTSGHEMIRNHHIAVMALLTGDTMVMKRLYPEWGLEVRLPHFARGTLLWYCTRHGLFAQEI